MERVEYCTSAGESSPSPKLLADFSDAILMCVHPAAEVRRLPQTQLRREHPVVPPMRHGPTHLLLAQPLGRPTRSTGKGCVCVCFVVAVVAWLSDDHTATVVGDTFIIVDRSHVSVVHPALAMQRSPRRCTYGVFFF